MSLPPAPLDQDCGRGVRSRIVVWDSRRGFGYAEIGGRRVFVHHREFVRKARPPRKGDRISFVLGADAKGRPCARAIELLGGGDALRLRDLALLAGLLLLPVLAFRQLAWSPWISAGTVGFLSLLTWWNYRVDKERAQNSGWRVSEAALQALSFCGGWPGALLAQRQFRHKTAKASFQLVFRAIVLLHQAFALDFLLGWPGLRSILEGVNDLVSRLPG